MMVMSIIPRLQIAMASEALAAYKSILTSHPVIIQYPVFQLARHTRFASNTSDTVDLPINRW